jgi:hypothetical protein
MVVQGKVTYKHAYDACTTDKWPAVALTLALFVGVCAQLSRELRPLGLTAMVKTIAYHQNQLSVTETQGSCCASLPSTFS